MPFNINQDNIGFNNRFDGIFNLPFNEQIEYFRNKINLPSEHYDDILKSAHDRAFIVAGAAKADLLNDFRQAIDKAISEGKSLGWFQKQFDEIVNHHGWDYIGDRDWRSRVIYRTNMAASYAAGRQKQLTDPELLKRRPYWKYVHNDTVLHPRPLHVAWSGLVLKHDDPWWQTHFPPNGWGCRCRVMAVKPSEYEGAKAPDEGVYVHEDRYGQRHVIPNGIDYGWDYQPGAKRSTPFKDLIDQKLIRFAPTLGADLWQSVKPFFIAEQTRSVQEMVSEVISTMKPTGTSVIAHVIEPGVVAGLISHNVIMENASVWLRDHELIHALRDVKTAKDSHIPNDIWLNLPVYLDAATAYLDTMDQALLYVFDVPGQTAKIVIRVNPSQKIRDQGDRKRIIGNFIKTGGIVEEFNISSGGRYIKLE